MVWDVLVARWLHILAATIWVGNGFALALWWGPASMKAGKTGEEFWEVLVKRTVFVRGMSVLTIITVGAGLYLYWRLEYLARLEAGASAVVLTVGAVAGLILGVLTPVHMRFTNRIWELRGEAGPEPTVEQEEAIARVGRQFVVLDAFSILLALVAVTGMAIARYV